MPITRSLVLTALVFSAVQLLAYARVRAAIEYCPAAIYGAHALNPNAAGDASLWSFAVSALGPRSVQGAVMVETSDGWYTFQFPPATLTAHDGTYAMGKFGDWHKTDYVSQPLYVMFPQPLKISYWWLDEAVAFGDRELNWDQRGLVACEPTIGPGGPNAPLVGWRKGVKPAIGLDAIPPPGTAFIVAASASPPPGASSCSSPFVPATAVSVARAEYPREAEDEFAGQSVEVVVFVSIDATGKVRDAWVVGTSGDIAIDGDALRVARQSSYRSGVALCRPVPGTYWLLVDYNG